MQKVKLGDIASVVTKGTTPLTMGYDFIDQGINFIKIEAISDDGSFIDKRIAHISEECHKKLSRSQLEENDILFSIAGAIGRVAIVTKKYLPANTNQALAIVRIPSNYINYRYLFYALQSDTVKKQINSYKQGVAQLNLSLKNINDLVIVLHEEQKAIAEKLDKVSCLIEKRKQQLSLLDTLVKSKFVEMFGDVLCNSKRWIIKKGKELFKFSSGKFLPEEKRKSQGIPVYGGNGITWFTDQALIDYSTIIIGRVGAYCGNVRKIEEPVWITDNAIYVKKFLLKINLTFLLELMMQMKFYKFSDFSGQPKITQKPLEECNYILPPLDLQEKFADFVKQTEKTKAKIKQSLSALELLKKSLMQKYFG